VLAVVLHFDHLFCDQANGTPVSGGVTDFDRIATRIDRLFAQLSFWRSALGVGHFDLAEQQERAAVVGSDSGKRRS
jgi:hypothetical protein